MGEMRENPEDAGEWYMWSQFYDFFAANGSDTERIATEWNRCRSRAPMKRPPTKAGHSNKVFKKYF